MQLSRGIAFLALLLLATSPTNVQAQKKAILGIDVGAAFMKVAVIQPGRLPDIVTNTASKRKTETAVAFDNTGHRLFAGDAANANTRTPLQVYSQLPSLLGVSSQHPVARAAIENFLVAHNTSTDAERGTVVFTHPKPGVEGETMHLSPEDLTAMLLGYAKSIGEEFAAEGGERGKITDCVLTVPSFYTQTQRQALLDAARIADLKVLALVDANTAAAVQYGLDRKEDKTVLIFNMGAESSQASLVGFTTRTMGGRNVTAFRVIAKAWENLVGGGYLSTKVRDEFAKEYNQQRAKKSPDYDAFHRPRAMARLLKAADKTKQVLSANKASPPVFVSSVDNDIDYKGGKWERKRLEGLAGDFFERSLRPVDRVLRDAGNLTLADVDVVEIIGGGLRIPKMQSLLKEYFNPEGAPEEGAEIGVHLNGDEAVALGSVFVAANRSRSFRVRHVDMTDVLPFQIQVELKDIVAADASSDEASELWSKQTTLAKPHRPFKSKTVSFVHTKDIELALRYINNEEAGSRVPEGTPPLIARYSVTGVEDAVQNELYRELDHPKVKLSFELDRFGLIQLSKAHAEFQETVIEQVEEKIPINETESDTEDADADTTAEDLSAEAEASETDDNKAADAADSESAEEDADAAVDADAAEQNEENEKKKAQTKKKKKQKQKYKTILVDREKVVKHKEPLTIVKAVLGIDETSVRNLSEEQFATSQKFYKKLEKAEKAARDLENARNELETYLYSARDILTDTKGIDQVLTEETREEMRESIMDSLDWLEDDDTGLHASIHQVRAKKTEHKEAIENALFRLEELQLRPKALSAARAVLEAAAAKIEEWQITKPQITEEEFDDLRAKIETASTFLDESESTQAKLTDYHEPAFTTAEVSRNLKPVQNFVERLMKKPAPIPVVEETPLQDDDATTDESMDGEDKATQPEADTDGAEDTSIDSSEDSADTQSPPHDDL